MDLKSAYHQIALHPDDKEFTAFQGNGKLYQFTRLPFGLTNAVSAFQRVMDNIILKHKLNGVVAYLDDVIIVGKTKEAHDINLQRFLTTTEELKITLNKSKCIFGQTAISFLGYRIEKHQLKPDPERLDPLKNYPLPRDEKSLQRLMGLFSYYSKWLASYSEIIQPLLKVTFPLSKEAIATIERLKELITKASLTPLMRTQNLILRRMPPIRRFPGSCFKTTYPSPSFLELLEYQKGHYLL